jgi:hypothetical protein
MPIPTSEPATVAATGVFHNPNAAVHGVPTGPASTTYPASSAPAGGIPSPTELMRDRNFVARFLSKDAAAVAQWEAAHKAQAGETAAASTPSEQINRLKSDSAFAKRVADGDIEATRQWNEAHQAAGADAAPADPASINAAAGLPATPEAAEALAMAYQMPKLADQHGDYSPAAQQFDKFTRNALATAGFDRGNGSFLTQEIGRTHDHYSKLDDAGKQLYMQQQEQTLRGIWKGDYDSNLRLARQLATEIDRKHPGALDILIDSGAANNALVISQLYDRALAIAMAKGVDLTKFK